MRSIIKKMICFLLFLLLCGVGFYLWKAYQNREPDFDKILQNSVLNNRHFSVNVQEIESPSGIKAYLMSDFSSPLVSISFKFLRSGLAYEESKLGRANFLADMLTLGTTNLSAEQYAQFLLQNGIKVGFSADYDDFDGQFTFPLENYDSALKVLKETLYSPLFDINEMNILKSQYEASFAAQKESESARFSQITRPILYGDHPYSRNPLGDIEDIKKLNAADLAEYMRQHFNKNNLIVSLSGAVDEDKAKDIIEILFSGLPENGENSDIKPVEHNFYFEKHTENQNFAQTRIMFTAKGVYRDDADFYPLYVANFIFGGSGLTSRLNEELRGKRGLTYGAYSGLSIRDKDAVLSGSFTTSPDNAKEALEIALAEWKKFGENGVKKDEFSKAKKYMIDSFNLRFDSNIGISSMLTEIQKYNLGKDFLQKRNDYIRAITLEDVNRAAKKYFNDKFIVIEAGQTENE